MMSETAIQDYGMIQDMPGRVIRVRKNRYQIRVIDTNLKANSGNENTMKNDGDDNRAERQRDWKDQRTRRAKNWGLSY